MLNIAPEIQDDLQLWLAFRLFALRAGPSHLNLQRPLGAEHRQDQSQRIFVETTGAETTIRVSAFDTKDWDTWQGLMQEIGTAPPEKLVFDLRECRGGDFMAAVPLAQLFAGPIALGYLMGRDGFSRHGRPQAALEIGADRELWLDTPQALIDLHGERGTARLWGRAVGHSFDGEVLVLTSAATSSAAEAFCAVIKSHKRGRIVGEKTAGSLLSSDLRTLADDWVLRVPTALYIAPDLAPVEGHGIEPDR